MGPGREFDLIRRFLATDARARSARSGTVGDGAAGDGADGAAGAGAVRVGPGDDCAVIAGDGIAVTVDMAMEDIHFRRSWLEPGEIGWRAAAASLSDLAGMAARPIGVLVSVALPPGDEDEYGVAVVRGVSAAAAAEGAVLLGGDTIRSPGRLVVDVVALGEAPRPVLREGAAPGDEVWVTGTLGGAAAAVRAWTAGGTPAPPHRSAYARPRPRVREALWLAERNVPVAMVDLSDGLVGDAGHIAAASGARLEVHAGAIPRAASGTRDEPVDLALAAAGGEDYELCLVARPGTVEGLTADFERAFGIPLTRVGAVREGQGAVVVDEDGSAMELKAWQHWGE